MIRQPNVVLVHSFLLNSIDNGFSTKFADS